MPSMIRAIIALAISTVSVHAVYVTIILPRAEQALFIARESGLTAARTLAVILKDYEQETCIILMFWGIYLIFEKGYTIVKHRYLFDMKLIADEDSTHLDSPGSAQNFAMQEMQSALREFEKIEDAETRNTPLIKTLSTAARRYIATEDVQNTSDAIVTGVEALAARIESGNSMIRYLIWAIPSIGFIGTVRGIGQALSAADQALAGDISAMTNSLGVAFNSTLVALVISILLMFLLHELQRMQDKLVVDTQAYCEDFLLKRIEKK